MMKSEAVQKLVDYMDREVELKGRLTALGVINFLESLGMLPPYKPGEEPFGYNEGYIEAPYWEAE